MAGDPRTVSLDNQAVEAAYARWAPVYDFAFDLLMAPGRKAAVSAAQAAAARAGGPILDVGVGTGLELSYFSQEAGLVGVDLSEPMLRRAQRRVAKEGLRQVVGLARMDATRLAFPDAAFAAVIAPFVMTVVPDPARTLAELLRVTKPRGEIVLVNHIGAQSGLWGRAEAALAKASKHLGWRPEFPWSTIGDWIAAEPAATLLERREMPPFGLFTLVRIARA